MTPEQAFLNIKQKADDHRNYLNESRPQDWNVPEDHQLWIRREAERYPTRFPTMARAFFFILLRNVLKLTVGIVKEES